MMNGVELYTLIRFAGSLNANSLTSLQWDAAASYANDNLVLADLAHHATSRALLVNAGLEVRNLFEAAISISQEIRDEVISECVHINSALSSALVESVFLKGAAILLAEYEDYPGSRFVSDIDVLVSKDDIDTAVEVMEKIGYSFEDTLPRPIGAYWSSKHLPPMTSKDARWSVELHIRPIDSLPGLVSNLTGLQVFKNSIVLETYPDELRVPSDNDLLFQIFYHSAIFDGYLLANVEMVRAYLDTRYLLNKNSHRSSALIDILNGYGRLNNGLLKFVVKKYYTRYANFIYHENCSTQNGNVPTHNTGSERKTRKHSNIQRYTLKLFIGLRGIRYMLLKSTRIERAILQKANPEDFRYDPVLWQILNPRIMWNRIQRVFNS